MKYLQPNTTLQGGKYRIERVLGQGGFGITYLAHNTVFDVDVAIKEFFMKDENGRDGTIVTMPNTTKSELFQKQKEKFKKEAKRMFAIKNEHIIGVNDLFEENGTAYYVMDYVDGENLNDRLKRMGRPMTESEVKLILPQILDALKAVHDAKIWHLDLKPANIMLDKNGQVKLIDFGASKQMDTQKGGATSSTAISYTNGFAPREQMEQNYDKFGPWTDIYALGATLYNLLTNKRPPLPTDIDDDMSEDKHLALPMPNVGDNMKRLVLSMMKTNRMQRPQTIQEVKDLQLDEKHNQVAPKEEPESVEKVSEDEETKIVDKKEDVEAKNQPSAVDDAFNLVNYQDSNENLFNNLTVPINKGWISLALILSILCFIGILSPLIVSTWGEHLPDYDNWVLWGIEERKCSDFYIPCTSFFHLIKAFLLFLLCKGMWNYYKPISYISMLCIGFEIVLSIVLSHFLDFSVYEYSYYTITYNIGEGVAYCTFISIFFLGVFIVKHLEGKITILGWFFVVYGVISIAFTLVQGEAFGYLGYWIEITWIIAMWWMLSRKEVANESH